MVHLAGTGSLEYGLPGTHSILVLLIVRNGLGEEGGVHYDSLTVLPYDMVSAPEKNFRALINRNSYFFGLICLITYSDH